MTNEQQAIYIQSLRRRLKTEIESLEAELLANESVPRKVVKPIWGEPFENVDCLAGIYSILNDLDKEIKMLQPESE